MATPAGGAIAVVRLSGPDAIAIADRLFSRPLHDAAANTLHHGTLRTLQGEDIDEVVVAVYRAPHSYTGEDSIEISCHGSAYIAQTIVHTLIEAGARQAGPGEYTQRAYLNGKMDLSQAEAVNDIIRANNAATHRLALSQLKGHFSSRLAELREQLLRLTTLLELELDFSDHEELEFASRQDIECLANAISSHIERLANSFRLGNALKAGIPVAIIGKPNVGKSTLLNRLLGEERAIVSAIPGTTRDSIEDLINIQGVTFRIIDTAGLHDTTDQIEQIGIQRAYDKLSQAHIVIWLTEQQPSEDEKALLLPYLTDKALIIAHNKVDVNPSAGEYADIVISAKEGTGIPALEAALYKAADIPELPPAARSGTSARPYAALVRAHESLSRVTEGLHLGLSADLLSEDLRIALTHLSEILGAQITPQETLNNIFKHFCVGK